MVTRIHQIANEIFIDSALESHRLLVTISKPVISQHSASKIIFYILTFQEKSGKRRKKTYFASFFLCTFAPSIMRDRESKKFRSCLVEMLLESKRVKIDGLGTFFTTIENEKGGALSKDDFNVSKNLKALHIRFIPEGEQILNISSREFIKKAEFINIDTLQTGKKEETPTPSTGD